MSKLVNSIKRALHPARWQKYLLRLTLKGNNVECPCCGSRYITFLPAGINKRPNASCLKCGSLERHRNLWLYFENTPSLFKPGNKILHVAPEKIFTQYFLSHKNGMEYYAIDLHPEEYDYYKKTIQMDLTDLKFENDFFDGILCTHVLEHVPNDRKAMLEMCRVLKPGGWAIINVPVHEDRATTFEDVTINDPKKQLELFGQPDHVRIYGKDYVDRLKEAGFKVEIIQWTKNYSSNERFRFGLKEYELIYLCTK